MSTFNGAPFNNITTATIGLASQAQQLEVKLPTKYLAGLEAINQAYDAAISRLRPTDISTQIGAAMMDGYDPAADPDTISSVVILALRNNGVGSMIEQEAERRRRDLLTEHADAVMAAFVKVITEAAADIAAFVHASDDPSKAHTLLTIGSDAPTNQLRGKQFALWGQARHATERAANATGAITLLVRSLGAGGSYTKRHLILAEPHTDTLQSRADLPELVSLGIDIKPATTLDEYKARAQEEQRLIEERAAERQAEIDAIKKDGSLWRL